MISVPWQWGQCRTCIIMLSLGWLGGCSASHTPRENSRPTPLKHPPRPVLRDRLVLAHGEPIRIEERRACLELLRCSLSQRANRETCRRQIVGDSHAVGVGGVRIDG